MPPKTAPRKRPSTARRVPQRPRGPRLVLPRRLEIDPIITMTSEGIIQSASESVEKVFGWTPMELFGRNVKLLIPEPRRSALDRYLDRYRHSDRTKALQRTRMFDAVRKDGTVVHIELSVSRADLPSHAEPYFIGIIRDVSKDIEVGRESADVRSRLQELVTEQTRALATANLRLQLSDRLASLGTLAAGLGHDMHNMLLPIRARLNALEHAGISGPALAHVAAVRRSISYLQHLSEGLHFLAADPDGPGVSIDGVGTTDLAHWWSQVGELLCKAIPARVKVKASIPAGMPEVKTAPHWLTQAVLNLLVNAAESMPPGRRDPLVKVWATASDDGRTVRLGVTDNGRGMTREVQRRAFDLFFTTKARGMSTGLGLPLVRKVAVRAGGLVDLSSSPGRGTTVVLTLPTTRRTAPRAAPPGARKQMAVVSIRNHRAVALISQMLQSGGLRVREDATNEPGNADIWITTPTGDALAKAERWVKKRKARSVVLFGAPSKATQSRWTTLGATIIASSNDFLAVRRALGEAMERLRSGTPSGAHQ